MLYIVSQKNNAPNFALNALISALLCALPFTFPNLFITAWVGLIPFFASLMSDDFFKAKKRTVFRIGFVWGFLYCSFIYYWFCHLYPLDFAGFTPPAAFATVLIAWLGISAVQSLVFGAGTLVYRVIGRKSPIILALIFMLCEFCWYFGDLAMPWCKIGITQYKFLPAIQSSSLLGSLFVSFLIYAVNALIASGAKNKKYLCAAAVLFFSNILYGAIMLNIPVEYTSKAHFSLIQGNISSSEKWESGSAQRSFDMFYDLSIQAAQNADTDFVVWPESAVPIRLESGYKDLFLSVVQDTDSIFLLGSFGEEEGRTSNSLFMIDQNGVNDTFYSKRHLVPFGEYLPMRGFFQTFLPFIADINMLSDDLYQGKESRVMESEFGNIGSLVCFDSIFPTLTRKSVLDGAQVMVLITNDSWYFDSPATYQHAAQAVFRAVENRRAVARCANTGITMLIDERGRIIDSLAPLKKGYVSGELGFTNANTLYTYIGDIPIYAAISYILILLIRRLASKWKLRPLTSEKTTPQ